MFFCRSLVGPCLMVMAELRVYHGGEAACVIMNDRVKCNYQTWRPEFGKREHLVNDLLVRIHSIVSALFKGCESGAPIVLRSTTTLLIAEMLSSVGCEKAFKFRNHVSEMHNR